MAQIGSTFLTDLSIYLRANYLAYLLNNLPSMSSRTHKLEVRESRGHWEAKRLSTVALVLQEVAFTYDTTENGEKRGSRRGKEYTSLGRGESTVRLLLA